MRIVRDFVALMTLGCAMPAMGGLFVGLGDLAGGEYFSSAYGISPDGQAVVGVSMVRGYSWDGFLWRRSSGVMEPLAPDRPLPDFAALPTAVANEGRAVAGFLNGGYFEPFRWTPEGGYQALGSLPTLGMAFGWASGISADGRTVVGMSRSRVRGRAPYDMEYDSEEAFIWTPERGMVGLGFGAESGLPKSAAYGVSADGLVVTGEVWTNSADIYPTQVFRWTEAGGMQGLGVLPGMRWSNATAISADGSTIVGTSAGPVGETEIVQRAFIWNAAEGMRALPGLAGEGILQPYGVSGDGSVVVGWAYGPEALGTAVIWTREGGTRPLMDILREAGVMGAEGWALVTARSISADGRTITGIGVNPGGDYEAWIVTIPPPGSAAVAVIGAAVLGWRGRRESH